MAISAADCKKLYKKSPKTTYDVDKVFSPTVAKFIDDYAASIRISDKILTNGLLTLNSFVCGEECELKVKNFHPMKTIIYMIMAVDSSGGKGNLFKGLIYPTIERLQEVYKKKNCKKFTRQSLIESLNKNGCYGFVGYEEGEVFFSNQRNISGTPCTDRYAWNIIFDGNKDHQTLISKDRTLEDGAVALFICKQVGYLLDAAVANRKISDGHWQRFLITTIDPREYKSQGYIRAVQDDLERANLHDLIPRLFAKLFKHLRSANTKATFTFAADCENMLDEMYDADKKESCSYLETSSSGSENDDTTAANRSNYHETKSYSIVARLCVHIQTMEYLITQGLNDPNLTFTLDIPKSITRDTLMNAKYLYFCFKQQKICLLDPCSTALLKKVVSVNTSKKTLTEKIVEKIALAKGPIIHITNQLTKKLQRVENADNIKQACLQLEKEGFGKLIRKSARLKLRFDAFLKCHYNNLPIACKKYALDIDQYRRNFESITLSRDEKQLLAPVHPQREYFQDAGSNGSHQLRVEDDIEVIEDEPPSQLFSAVKIPKIVYKCCNIAITLQMAATVQLHFVACMDIFRAI